VVGSWWNAVDFGLAYLSIEMAGIQVASGQSNNRAILNAACGSVKTDIQVLRNVRASTDPAIDPPWQAALNLYARAVSECLAAAGVGNRSGLNAANQDSAAANKVVLAVSDRVRILGIDTGQLPTVANIPMASNPAVRTWWNEITKDYAGVRVDLQVFSAAADSLSYPAVQAACRELTIYVQTLQKDPGPPTSSPWQAGLGLYARGAAQCASASNPASPDMKGLLAGNADIASGNQDVVAVLYG
jgi:hypothetical protein